LQPQRLVLHSASEKQAAQSALPTGFAPPSGALVCAPLDGAVLGIVLFGLVVELPLGVTPSSPSSASALLAVLRAFRTGGLDVAIVSEGSGAGGAAHPIATTAAAPNIAATHTIGVSRIRRAPAETHCAAWTNLICAKNQALATAHARSAGWPDARASGIP